MLKGYQKLIQESTGCTNEEAGEIEEIMRHDIFHSTLDWVPKDRFVEAANQAYEMMKLEGEF